MQNSKIELPVKTPWQVLFFPPTSCSITRSSTWLASTVKLQVASISFWMCFLYRLRSIWALCPQTAGPFLLLRTLYWIPETSTIKCEDEIKITNIFLSVSDMIHELSCLVLENNTDHISWHRHHLKHQFPWEVDPSRCLRRRGYKTSRLKR